MSSSFAISRVANYKFSDVGGVLKEALRTLPNYDNPDCDPSKSYLNVALVDIDLCGLTPEKYILKYREDNNVKGRFNTSATNPKNLTNCMFQVLFTASPEYLADMSREEQIEYFKRCLEFFRSEFPSAHIMAANIHFDETTPHMHVTALPTVERVNKKTGELETIFSTTKLMPGKDFFPKYQDRFYSFISSQYDGFTRSHSNRKNLSVKAYKEFREMETRYQEALFEVQSLRASLKEANERINSMYLELSKLRKERSFLEDVPLLGFFISLIREIQQERLEKILKEAIKLAQREREDIKRELEERKPDLESVIADSKRRSIIQSLYGKKPRQHDFDIEK